MFYRRQDNTSPVRYNEIMFECLHGNSALPSVVLGINLQGAEERSLWGDYRAT